MPHRGATRPLSALALGTVVLTLAGCTGGGDSEAGATPATSVRVPPTTAAARPTTTVLAVPLTTLGPTSAPQPTVEPTAAPPAPVSADTTVAGPIPPAPPATEPLVPAEPTTTTACVPPDAQVPDGEDGVVASPLVAREIQTSDVGCFERVIVMLQGQGFTPRALLRWSTGPVLDPQGVPIEGPILLLTIDAALRTPTGGYPGPTDIATANVSGITRLLLVEETPTRHTWAIVLAGFPRNFRLTSRIDTERQEFRLVVDVAKA